MRKKCKRLRRGALLERISSRSVPDFLFFFAFSGVTICTGFYRCFLIGAVFSLSNSCSKMCVRKLRSARKTNTNAFLAFPALVWDGSGVDTSRIDFRPNSYNKCGNYRWFRIGDLFLYFFFSDLSFTNTQFLPEKVVSWRSPAAWNVSLPDTFRIFGRPK